MNAKEYIETHIQTCNNQILGDDCLYGGYDAPWLTPEQALRAVEIEREELIDKACKWLEENLAKETLVIVSGVGTINFENVISKFRKIMEE